MLEGVLKVIRDAIDKKNFTWEPYKWLILKTHDDFLNYGDLDIFVIFEASEANCYYSVAKNISTLSSELTIAFDKYVTIYPMEKSNYLNATTQFMRNLKSKEIII